MNKYIFILLLFVNALLSAFSQVLLKKAALRNYNSVLKQYLNPNVIVGYGIYFIVIFINIFALKHLNMSTIAAFSESLPLVFTLVFSKIVFNESINRFKIFGIAIIVLGIFVISI